MAITVGAYEGFTLHLCVPLLVQDDVDRDEEMVNIIKIDNTELEDSHLQATSPLLGVRPVLGVPSEVQPQR